MCPVRDAIERMASESGAEERGAIYTRREVVEFILDLVGYTVDRPLAEYRLLEPSFGAGDFLLPALQRLLEAARHSSECLMPERLEPALRGVELHRDTFERTKQEAHRMLVRNGVKRAEADRLVQVWLRQGDFLLESSDHEFTHIVGNPPYVRHESVPDILMKEYRRRFETIYDRADLYVPFIEKSLRSLVTDGTLGFICSDRWTKNRYGKKLRTFVSLGFSLVAYIDMVDTDAFHSEVSAYPAIFVISRKKTPATRVYSKPTIDQDFLSRLADEITQNNYHRNGRVRQIQSVARDSSPWVLNSFDQLALVRRLEETFPLIEEVGCKIGIGVATGADREFIGDYNDLAVENTRKLPLVQTKDISSGRVKWRGKGIINPFDEHGKLVQLEDYPRLRAYFEKRRDRIAKRHIAKKSPLNWYRTIDRIYPDLTFREKLLIPDIKGDAAIVYEEGNYYPHHNLYYITSTAWDVRSLMVVLRSGIANLFVSLYSTRMRGGYLRFQAQYLRRLRIPQWDTLKPSLRERLAHASNADDRRLSIAVVSEIYGLTAAEQTLLDGGPRTR